MTIRAAAVTGAAVAVAWTAATMAAPAQQERQAQQTQQQQTPFRTGTDLVPVYVTVTDEDTGRLVTDLELLDFQIKDDGQIRPIALFSRERQPASVIVLLDRSASMFDHFDEVRDGAIEFIRQMGPGDQAQIGVFSDRIEFLPDGFSGDPRLLERLLRDELPDMGPSPVWESIDRSMTALLPLPGRRVVLVFSDGHDDPALGQGLTRLPDLLRRTRTNGIMVYAIGFAGEVTQASRRTSWLPRFPGGSWPPRGGKPAPSPRGPIEFTRTRHPPDPGLRELALESGGGYFEMDASGDLTAIFARVATELHQQYWLGFTPARLDGKVHDIEVTVKRRGLEVRARRNYLAADPSSR